MPKNIYKGFSSFEFQSNKTFRVSGIELVKFDLLNHIFTRKGERVMMPAFGTNVPNLVFEPLDEITSELISEELRTVFEYDPRVQLMDMEVSPNYDTNSIYVAVKLFFVEFNVADDMELNIQFEI